MRLIGLAAILALCCAPVAAQETVVLYVEHQGRFIELCENHVDQLYGKPGSRMAVEASAIVTAENRAQIAPESEVVRWWRPTRGGVAAFFEETGKLKHFPASKVKIIRVERPWLREREAPVEPVPS